jgi:hypothetical protein
MMLPFVKAIGCFKTLQFQYEEDSSAAAEWQFFVPSVELLEGHS